MKISHFAPKIEKQVLDFSTFGNFTKFSKISRCPILSIFGPKVSSQNFTKNKPSSGFWPNVSFENREYLPYFVVKNAIFDTFTKFLNKHAKTPPEFV